MLKKLLSILLALTLAALTVACNKDEDPDDNKGGGGAPPTENTGDEEPTLSKSGELEDSDIVWEIYSDNTMYLKCKGTHAKGEPCEITDFDKLSNGNLNQPWWENGGRYTTERPTDGGATTVSKLVIGEGITALGKYAFAKMQLLTEVTLPSTLKEISYFSFYQCPKLKTVLGGFGVTHIEASAFASCTDLETVELSPALIEVEESAFGNIIPTASSKKLALKIKGTEEAWAAAVTAMETTEKGDGIPGYLLGQGNDAFKNATVTYIPYNSHRYGTKKPRHDPMDRAVAFILFFSHLQPFHHFVVPLPLHRGGFCYKTLCSSCAEEG